jgi:hypothetical protein
MTVQGVGGNLTKSGIEATSFNEALKDCGCPPGENVIPPRAPPNDWCGYKFDPRGGQPKEVRCVTDGRKDECNFPGELRGDGRLLRGFVIADSFTSTNTATFVYDPDTGQGNIAGVDEAENPGLADAEFYEDANGNVSAVRSVWTQVETPISAWVYDASTGDFIGVTPKGTWNIRLTQQDGGPWYEKVQAMFNGAEIDLPSPQSGGSATYTPPVAA